MAGEVDETTELFSADALVEVATETCCDSTVEIAEGVESIDSTTYEAAAFVMSSAVGAEDISSRDEVMTAGE